MNGCNLCGRRCGVDRTTNIGYCGAGVTPRVAFSMLHKWEEPCISGKNGSGAVFFSGCSLRCIYCQNKKISRSADGEEYSPERLARLFISLQEQGAHNINLVTPTHYADGIAEALKLCKQPLLIPVVWNTGGYDTAESIRSLRGLVDIFLTDLKYLSAERAERYSAAANYPETAKTALDAMVDMAGPAVIENGMMTKGVIVRHLVLPEGVSEAKRVVKYVYERYKDDVYLSLMRQYTPTGGCEAMPELQRRLTRREYDRVCEYALSLGVQNAFIQESGADDACYIPNF